MLQLNTQGTLTGFLVAGVGAAVLMAGCSRTPRVQRPPTYPVQGTVLMGGKPIAEATVMFNPIPEGNGAIAVTDAEGRYQLTTFVPNDGAMAGDYKVAIVKTVFGNAQSDSPMATSGDPKNMLPVRYANGETSGFTATVVAGPDNRFDFALEK